MTHPITPLGAIHTVISLVPIVAGLYSFASYRKIYPAVSAGKIYLAGLVLSVITSFGVSSTGGLNPGHAFGVLVLLVAFFGLLVPRVTLLGGARPYLSAFGLSFSFFLSLVPGTNETLTRLPPAHPLATGPTSTVVITMLLIWFVLFVVGYAAQCRLIYTGQAGDLRQRA